MAFIKLGGIPLKAKDLPTHTWNADLVEFEGPLISLYRSERGDDVLYVWLDCTATRNRWAITPLSRNALRDYLTKKIPLRAVFEQSNEIIVFETGTTLKRSGFQLVTWANFPEQYKPKENSYLTDRIATPSALRLVSDNTEDYYLGLDGEDLYVEDLSAIQKGFVQLYSFHYGLEYMDRDAVKQKVSGHAGQWTGGMSAVWMFDGLNSVIPSIHRPRVGELRYNSPGHIKLNLLPELAADVQRAVQRVVDPGIFSLTEALYQRVYSYFRKSGIAGFESERQDIKRNLTPEVNATLTSFVITYLELMDWSSRSQMLQELEDSPLAQIRLLFAYYRRLRKLRGFVVEGRLDVGNSSLVGKP
ncbi:hypothetical protein [Pseudomonas mediterranea]|uniref:hypothetical protein n=1 Tax=Pseudomonas mediterranea TaxID=183795 RepID=UPI000AAB1640|nr:hypothetical protein [Pseudomonas mediterranea]MDU9030532.1 hypothetical protein [Pseudomonas mediterranea]